MAILRVQSVKKDVKTVNNTTLAFASALQSQSLLISSIVTFQSTAGTSITTPTDTLAHSYLPIAAQQNDGANKTHLRSFYVPSATAGSDTVTADISGTDTGEITLINSEWSGVEKSSPLSGTPVTQQGLDPSTGTITPAHHGCLLIAVLNAGGTSVTIDISAASLADGWQLVEKYEGGNTSVTLSVIYKIQTVATPTSASWTLGGVRSCLTHIMAFRPFTFTETVAEEEFSDQVGTDRYRDPVLATSIQSPWLISTASPFKRITTTVPFDVHSGDLLLALGLIQTDTLSGYQFEGGLLKWQTLSIQEEDPGAGSTQGVIILASALVDFHKRMTVSLKRDIFTGIARFGLLVLIYRDCSGVGNIVKTVGDNAIPSLSIDSVQPHSDILIAIVDNDAEDGVSRTWRETAGKLNELTYYRTVGGMTVYCGYHTNVVRPNRYTVGLLGPGSQQYSMMAAEIKGNPVPDRAMDIAF
jgi:hypothetical protein